MVRYVGIAGDSGLSKSWIGRDIEQQLSVGIYSLACQWKQLHQTCG